MTPERLGIIRYKLCSDPLGLDAVDFRHLATELLAALDESKRETAALLDEANRKMRGLDAKVAKLASRLRITSAARHASGHFGPWETCPHDACTKDREALAPVQRVSPRGEEEGG